MKKNNILVIMIILLATIINLNTLNAATLSTNESIKYVNSSWYNIDYAEFNKLSRTWDTSVDYDSVDTETKSRINKEITLEKVPGDNKDTGWQNKGFGVSSNYCAVQGIVKSVLDERGNVELEKSYIIPDGELAGYQLGLIPDSKVASAYPSIYNTVYENYKFPFYLNNNGYYEFDSNSHTVDVDPENHKFVLYKGTNKGAVGFYPFNDPNTDDLSIVSNREYNFSGRIDIPFYLPKSGQVTSNGKSSDIVFNFSGDDDIWIFVDNKLALDIGGTHGAVAGNINFNTQISTVDNAAEKYDTYEEAQEAKLATGKNGVVTNYEKEGYYAIYGKDVENIDVKKGAKHTLTIFYTERATGESNFKAQFNLLFSGLIVKYLDKYTNAELANSVEFFDEMGSVVTSTPAEVEGYTLVESPSTNQHTIEEGGEEIIYYYAKNVDLTVKYVDEQGNEIESYTKTGEYTQGSTYTTERKEIEGYTFKNDSGNTSGTFGPEDIVVTYYYQKNSGGVDVRYIDQVTKQDLVLPIVHEDGFVGDSYTATSKEIPGYVLVASPKNETVEMTEEKITLIYEYRKLSTVSVRYVDANTNEDIDLSQNTSSQYKEGDNYITEKKNFEGYENIGDTQNIIGIVGKENIDVIYYYKKISGGVDVKYIDQVTRKDLVLPIIHEDGLEGDVYTAKSRQIEGYELVLSPENETVTMTVDKIVLTYEYRKISTVKVRYIDENTGLDIEDPVINSYKQGDTYNVQRKDIENYKFIRDSQNTNGVVERDNIEVSFYYKKISAGVDVKYIDQVTKEDISSPVHYDGLENDQYNSEELEIENYELVVTPANASGRMSVDKITVVYEYRKLSNLITRHIDVNTGNNIVDEVRKSYKEGDQYEALAQSIEGYVQTNNPDNKTGTMQREDIVVTFEYKRISQGLVVKYVDQITNDVLDKKEYSGNENDIVKLEELAFNNYILVSRPEETEVKLKPEPQELIFYYKRKISIPVEGIDQDTQTVLYTETKNGIEGDEYETSPREIENYKLVKEPYNKNGTYSRDSKKITYEYRKIAAPVDVKYIDKETEEEIEALQINGLVGDFYQTEQKNFEDYNFLEVKGNPNGVLSEEEQEIIYYYEKKKGKIIVTYEDKEGNILLQEELTGKVKEEYKIEEKEIEGYKVVERPERTEGIYEEGTLELRYILERKRGRVKVNFKDEQGNEIYPSIEDEGYINDEFYFEIPEKEGYYVDGDKEIRGRYEEGEIVIDVTYFSIPNTGDILVVPILILLALCVVGIVYGYKKIIAKK